MGEQNVNAVQQWLKPKISNLIFSPPGWELVFRHRVLNHIVYGHNQPPDPENFESGYADPDFDLDRIWILWVDGVAGGFCTVRYDPERPGDIAAVLDTVFVERSLRGRGYTGQLLALLLSDIVLMEKEEGEDDLPEQDLGLSSPISNGMLLAVYRFLRCHPGYRERIWTMERPLGDGVPIGRKKLFWWAAGQIAKKRDLILAREQQPESSLILQPNF